MKNKTLKIQKTPEEIAAKEAEKIKKKAVNKIAAQVTANCRSANVGLVAMEMQYEFLKSNNTTPLPDPELSKDDNLLGWRIGMLNYRERVGLPFVNIYK